MNDEAEGTRKIVLLGADYLPSRGGTTTQTKLHALEFLSRGWDVTVLTRRVPNCLKREQIDGIAVRRVGLPGRGRMAKGIQLFASWTWLLFRRRSVTALNVMLDADFALAALAAGLGSSTVLTWVTRGDATRQFGGRIGQLRRRLLRDCKQVVLTSRMENELLEIGISEVNIIPIPVDTKHFRKPSEDERSSARKMLGIREEMVVLYVGHLQKRKGVDLLIRAFALLREAGLSAQLVLVGEPIDAADREYAESLEQIVIANGLEKSVQFVGAQDDVAPYMFAADVFCLPSHREGMPNVLLEAMACGTACVAPASAGGDELLVDGLGIVPPSNSPADLSAALIAVLNDREVREALGERAANRVRGAFRPADIATAYEDLFLA